MGYLENNNIKDMFQENNLLNQVTFSVKGEVNK
jgi:hypothetical protein